MTSRIMRAVVRSSSAISARAAIASSARYATPVRRLHMQSVWRAAEPSPASIPSFSPPSASPAPDASESASPAVGFRAGGQRGDGQGRPESTWSTRLGVLLFLSTAAYTLYLGQWQIKRRAWKQEMIDRRTNALKAEPMSLEAFLAEYPDAVGVSGAPVTASQLAPSSTGSSDPTDVVFSSSAECRRLRVRGRLLHSRTLLLGPRTPPSGDGSSTAGQGSGYFLITPLLLPDGSSILVNRGWCPLKDCTKGSRGHYETSGAASSEDDDEAGPEVEVLGVLRRGEAQPSFLSNYDPISQGSFVWLDLPLMAYLTGVTQAAPSSAEGATAPPAILLDALEVQGGDGPAKRVMRRRTIGDYVIFTTTPFVHSVYAGTWFTLSAALVALTWVRFGRKAQPAVRKAQRAASSRVR